MDLKLNFLGVTVADFESSYRFYTDMMLSPSFISFETDNIEPAAAWIKSREVPVVTDITHHEWGGIDLMIADVDGNPVQVVQYTAA
jgi:hypothetical protein